MQVHQADVCVIGAGLAGVVAALELIERGHRVALVDSASAERCGGQANEAFGGMLLSGTPEQRRNGIRDNPELLLADWHAAAGFEDNDEWPRHWAAFYAENCRSMIYDWLKGHGIRFFPSVQWVERGNFGDGNTLPRYHIAWGCGRGVVQTLAKALFEHRNQHLLTSLFEHRVTDLEQARGAITGCSGQHGKSGFRVQAPHTVFCSGGISGNLDRVRANWASCYGAAPGNLLAGSHPDADGALHDVVSGHGGRVTHLDWMWNYAAGVRQPDPAFEGQGLSLIPPRSALWLDAYGQRIGPMPLVTGFDTHDLCCRVGNLPHQYSWQVLNRRMAIHERLISRKSMGGMMTDLNSRIMADNNTPVPGLYAAGEAAAAIHSNP